MLHTSIVLILLTCFSRFNSSLVTQRRHAWDGVYDPHTNLMHYPKITQPTQAKWERIEDQHEPALKRRQLTNGTASLVKPSIFEPVSKVIARNFLVTDTVFVGPQYSGLSVPRPNTEGYDVGPNGLPDVTEEILTELPEDCRKALLAAKEKESEWKAAWVQDAASSMQNPIERAYIGFPV
jgi:chromatin structure-remodeling complex protein RSC7